MLREKDVLAGQIALGKLDAAGIAQCYREAAKMLQEKTHPQYDADREAAKTWGGDIDLVSFEGE
jgi:hypothetical protein